VEEKIQKKSGRGEPTINKKKNDDEERGVGPEGGRAERNGLLRYREVKQDGALREESRDCLSSEKTTIKDKSKTTGRL